MKISFRASKFEFDLPIPNISSYTFTESCSSSVDPMVQKGKFSQFEKMYFLPAWWKYLETRNVWRSFSCPWFRNCLPLHCSIFYGVDFRKVFQFVGATLAWKKFRFSTFIFIPKSMFQYVVVVVLVVVAGCSRRWLHPSPPPPPGVVVVAVKDFKRAKPIGQ